MITLLSTWTFGAALALVALGVFVSYRLFRFPDVTTDGSFTLGAVCATVLLVRGHDPAVATAGGMAAGAVAGIGTGLLHAVFGIEPLLSGILMTTTLASVNLVVLGRSNVPLAGRATLLERGEAAFLPLARAAGFGEAAGEAAQLAFMLVLVATAAAILFAFFRTNLGTAMRAGGDTATMARALGRDTGMLTVAGLAISNALTALSGALYGQLQGFADVQMGIGMVVWGMASVFLGAALVGQTRLGGALAAAVAGSITFRLLVATALRAGLHPDWLKASTALVVFAALVVPRLLTRRPQGSAAR